MRRFSVHAFVLLAACLAAGRTWQPAALTPKSQAAQYQAARRQTAQPASPRAPRPPRRVRM